MICNFLSTFYVAFFQFKFTFSNEYYLFSKLFHFQHNILTISNHVSNKFIYVVIQYFYVGPVIILYGSCNTKPYKNNRDRILQHGPNA